MNIIRQYDPQQKLALRWRTKPTQPEVNVLEFAKALAEHTCGSWKRNSSKSATVTFTYSAMQPVYDALFVCQINERTREFSATVTLVKNSVPLKVSCSAVTILLSRHFNRLNADIKYFMFRANPFTREFSVKQTTVFTKRQFDETIGTVTTGIQYITTELNSAVEFIRFNLYMVLVQMGELSLTYLNILEDAKLDFRGFGDQHQAIEKQFSHLNHINLVSHIDFQFMHLDSLKRYSKPTQEELKEIDERAKEQLKAISDSMNRSNTATVVKHLKLYNNENEIRFQELRGHSRERIGFFCGVLTMRQPKSSTENIYQFQKIEVEGEGSPAQFPEAQEQEQATISRPVQKALLRFTNCPVEVTDLEEMGIINTQPIMRRFQSRINETRTQEYERVLCWQQGRQTENITVRHEKRILSNIMYCSSHYIGRYYFSSQQEQKEKLFVDYYPAASMQRYRQKHSLCFSLLSKLYLLSQACNGLRFLHDNKIYHLNFQLKNVMMGKGFLTRIIGFERALHPTVQCRDFCRVVEPPYSAPEIYQNTSPINEKADVYSVGVAMCELIFGCQPHEISDREKALAAYVQKSYDSSFGVTPDRMNYHGPEQYMKTLANTILRCVHPDPTHRPNLEWLVIFIKESITYIDLLY